LPLKHVATYQSIDRCRRHTDVSEVSNEERDVTKTAFGNAFPSGRDDLAISVDPDYRSFGSDKLSNNDARVTAAASDIHHRLARSDTGSDEEVPGSGL
jgi:hypothetical protein